MNSINNLLQEVPEFDPDKDKKDNYVIKNE